MNLNQNGAFRSVPKTGVIYVTSEAAKLGFFRSPQEWCNLGQGMPECGELAAAPPRIQKIEFDVSQNEYSPVQGITELRVAVADYYNRTYRKGRSSLYGPENVAISSGGRTALTRLAASLGNIHLGHFLPDYTAYEELLDIFKLFTPIPIALDPASGFRISPKELEKEILGKGLSALLFSNPCNPSGQLIGQSELPEWISLSRKLDCTLLIDEFYSHYIWNGHRPTVSAAEFIENVEDDNVVFIDGLTKNWRYAGWRIAWTVGPKRVIESLSSAGSFLDGGAPRPLQQAAIQLLEDQNVTLETNAIQAEFRRKKEYLSHAISQLGLDLHCEPDGTFYLFAKLDNLPEGLQDGMSFFRHLLGHKVICVPGEFFDVNPGKRRRAANSRFTHSVRLSFGPTIETLKEGVSRIQNAIATFRTPQSESRKLRVL